jgi:hypothetical protein
VSRVRFEIQHGAIIWEIIRGREELPECEPDDGSLADPPVIALAPPTARLVTVILVERAAESAEAAADDRHGITLDPWPATEAVASTSIS